MKISIDLINKIYKYIITHIESGKIYVKDIKNIRDIVYPNYKGWHDCDATFIMMIFRYVLEKVICGGRPCCIIF